MIRAKNRRRKSPAKNGIAALPAGVKVVAPPKSAVRRRLLSGPDIETSGGCRTVHVASAVRR